jgi:hypothetical protein
MDNEALDKKIIQQAWEKAKAKEAESKEAESRVKSSFSEQSNGIATPKQQLESTRKMVAILIIIIGIISGVMFFRGGNILYSEGTQLTHLESVSGNSIAEEYYQTIGRYGVAYSSLSYGCGWGIIAISFGLASNLLFSKRRI